MDNPKIRIESDGIRTEVYLDGEKVDSCISLDFHATVDDGIHVEWNGEKHKKDDNGKLVIENDDIVTEEFHYDSRKKAN